MPKPRLPFIGLTHRIREMTAGKVELTEWLQAGLGLIYPEVCQICEASRATAAEGYVCSRCWEQVRFIRPPFCRRCGLPFDGEITIPFQCPNCRDLRFAFSLARAAVVATGTALQIVHRYKYHGARWFEPFLAELLCRQLDDWDRKLEWDRVIPVPLHPVKRREREFNQAERIARHVAGHLRTPLDRDSLMRIEPTRSQTVLTRARRSANVKDAFCVQRRTDLNGCRILLIDDVFTTGATTNACAQVLRKAGAVEVAVWTVARGL